MVRDIIFPVTFGLVLFLFGMKLMEASLQAWAGPRLIAGLRSSTKTPLTGMLSSTVVTALLQSSTAVTVMTIGLVNAGLLSYARTLGIILGGNIGTCLTTELIALNISRWGPALAVGSIILWIASVLTEELSPRAAIAAWSHLLRPLQLGALVLLGFSLILIAIAWMQSIGPALEARGVIDWLLGHAGDSLLWGAAAGAVITALIHSSAAAIAMTMGLTATGVLPVPFGIAMVIGANVGTCVTAVIAAIGGTRSGRFVAWSHVLLNVAGAVLFLPLTPLLAEASAWISSDPAAQIAHSQTIFNVVCSILALPVCYLPLWSRLDKTMVPPGA
ncbi:Na/Pi-cotransporter [Paenibacillus antibioticophila]|uniref:Na/Pi-cotransporter n=1 Tax=Paenibacillus antibioticophila TaxID=1274374 RepID=A0A920CDL9_9BACL|nr:Na/Pi symporter [Paenibacillus antibioticophila]GIO36011.1 Na/Pi-cotransporter [Paenibacillus antibioticophila]